MELTKESLLEKTREAKKTQYPIDFIILNLGLKVDELRGKRVIDIGCGRDANLVRYLRGKGVEAEGIDVELREENKYIEQVKASRMRKRANRYDMAVSHNAHFKDGMLSDLYAVTILAGREAAKAQYERNEVELVRIIDQTIKALKPGCSFVIWPAPLQLLYQINGYLGNKGVSIGNEEIPSGRRYNSSDPNFGGIARLFGNEYIEVLNFENTHRTILTKGRN